MTHQRPRSATRLAVALLLATAPLLAIAQPAEAVQTYCTIKDPKCPGWVCVKDPRTWEWWICFQLCNPCPYPGFARADVPLELIP